MSESEPIDNQQPNTGNEESTTNDIPEEGTHLPDIGLVKPRILEQEIQESYLDYAMSVIVARALPDVRDGLKPVHRRILYTMHEMGLKAGSKHTKSAKIVGETMGKYHPHGDIAIYDTLARMAQPFSMRYTLIDGQGNFGSLDGDPPGAMRYTEARLAKLAEEMIADIDKETVPFIANYDSTLVEPQVLPSRVPNLLLNGALGIAVGMATNIPTHNLGELVDGLVILIDNPDLTIDELMNYIQGPDFPTGGIIYNVADIKTAYATGKGPIVMRAKADIEEIKNGFRIIVSEIPYQVNKADLIGRIAELVQEKRIDGVSDIRDESDRKEGVRIVIELKSNSYPKKVLNRLFELTSLQTVFHVNMLALVDGLQPKILTLKEILQHYLDHRLHVVTKRSEFELKRATERVHILEGLKKALDYIDAIIQLIKKSTTREEARVNLMQKYSLTDIQAEAILEMKLAQLAGLERKKVEDELTEKKKLVTYLTALLADRAKILGVIKDELLDIKNRFADERRTKIIKSRIGEFTAEDLIPNEYVVVTVTKGNYVKRVPVALYRSQARGGKGVMGMEQKEEDIVEHLLSTWTHNDIMFFTNQGRVFTNKVYDLPAASRQSRGQALVNFIQLGPDEKVTAVITVDSKENGGDKFFFMGTKAGMVKKTEIKAYRIIRKSGLIAVKLRPGDELGWVRTVSDNDKIMLVTRKGQAIAFPESEVRPMGRSATGVRGINLKKDDEVMALDVVSGRAPDLLVVSEKGLGKRTSFAHFREQHRGGVGIKALNITERTGTLVEALVVSGEGGDVAIVSEKGIVIRVPLKSVKRLGRATQGVRLMRVGAGDRVASVALIQKEPTEDKETSERLPMTRGPDVSSPVKAKRPAKQIKKDQEKTKEQPRKESQNYIVHAYKDDTSRSKGTIEADKRNEQHSKRNLDIHHYLKNVPGPEGDKNYWGADVWKTRK